MFTSLNGTQPERLARATALIERGREEGLHPGGQLYVSLRGQVLADLAFGEARVGIPMQTGSLMHWLSASKPITALALAQLWARAALDLDDPVSKVVPEFAQGGKQEITFRHLLTHTGGFRGGDKCDLGGAWDDIMDCVCRTPVERGWIPGARAGYHLASSWYILGETVRRLDGRPFEQFVREQILQPCGLKNTSLAMPVHDSRQNGSRLAVMYHTEKSPPVPHRRWNSEADAAICRPGRSGRGPIRELGHLYEVLLRGRDETKGSQNELSLPPAILRELTSRQRTGLYDETFRHVMDWGLGFGVDSNRYGVETVPYGYGRFCSEATFGHGGAESSCAFADPAQGLVVAWAFNGMPGERRHQNRARELNSAIYLDLGLA